MQKLKAELIGRRIAIFVIALFPNFASLTAGVLSARKRSNSERRPSEDCTHQTTEDAMDTPPDSEEHLARLIGLSRLVEANFEIIYRISVTQAKIKRAAYEAYVEQGFTEEQALELCKGGL